MARGESQSLGQGNLSRSSITSYWNLEGDQYTVTYANGDRLVAKLFAGFLIDPTVYLIDSQQVVGLLGNNNGRADDDLALRDGTVLANPLAPENLYGDFANSWQVTPEESLFNNTSLNGYSDNDSLSKNNGGDRLSYL